MGIFSSDEFGYLDWEEEHQKVVKYKKALQEIKEIAEMCKASLYGYDQEKYPKQILEKIKEVEDEN